MNLIIGSFLLSKILLQFQAVAIKYFNIKKKQLLRDKWNLKASAILWSVFVK